jgi:hypothetical protein
MNTNNLLITYDEATREICFFRVLADGKREFAIKVPLSLYQEKLPDQAEQVMGATVFAFFDRWADVKIGIREYAREAKESLADMRRDVAQRANDGDADAQYQMAIECFDSGVLNRAKAKIEEAEAWLKKASANGSLQATEYLNKHWERDKASALRAMS